MIVKAPRIWSKRDDWGLEWDEAAVARPRGWKAAAPRRRNGGRRPNGRRFWRWTVHRRGLANSIAVRRESVAWIHPNRFWRLPARSWSRSGKGGCNAPGHSDERFPARGRKGRSPTAIRGSSQIQLLKVRQDVHQGHGFPWVLWPRNSSRQT